MSERGGLPDTAAGRRLGEYLDAFNTGRVDALRAFVAEAVVGLGATQVDDRALEHAEAFEQMGGFDPGAVEASTETTLRVIGIARLTGEPVPLLVRTEEQPPYRVVALPPPLRPVPPRLEAGRAPTGPDAVAREARRFVELLAGADLFSGAVLVARDGAPLFAGAYGLAERAFEVACRLDTRFNVGSLGKMFTAVAIAQLVEQGRLSFDDPLARHRPDWPGADDERIRLHHLLSHTAGLGDFFGDRFWLMPRDRFRGIDDYLPLLGGQPPQLAPGADASYSNAGFIALGAVIEAVTGTDYYTHVRERVLAPAGMHGTDSYPLDADVPNRAVGYTRYAVRYVGEGTRRRREPGPRRLNTYLTTVRGSPAGGGYSTVEDLVRFGRALSGGQLVSPPMVQTLFERRSDATGGYGYGFHVHEVAGARVVGHHGTSAGCSATLDMYPDLGYAVAVLSNYDPPAANRVAVHLRGVIGSMVGVGLTVLPE